MWYVLFFVLFHELNMTVDAERMIVKCKKCKEISASMV